MKASMLIAALTACTATAVSASDKVTIGFISDYSGVNSAADGRGAEIAIRMAIEDFGGTVLDKPIELLTADHQNKADIAASTAREWIDTRNANMLIGLPTSGPALAVARVAEEKKIPVIVNAAASSAFTNEQCSPYTVHYSFDTVALAKGTAGALVADGGKEWFFITADYAFGHALEADASAVIKKAGGNVVGSIRAPFNASDFSSFVMQAQSSNAQILGLANAGTDTVNSYKAAREFGVNKKMQIAGLLVFETDIHAIGLENVEGLILTNSWYWDLNDETREFAEHFYEKVGAMPTGVQAAEYSSTLTYLNAVKAAGTTDSDAVMEQLKKLPINDMYAKDGYIRPDGRMVHDMYLMQVKSPSESTRPWDYLKLLKTMKGEDVFTTKEESKCKLWQ